MENSVQSVAPFGLIIESIAASRMVRQIHIKWKGQSDWVWMNEEDFLREVNGSKPVVEPRSPSRSPLKTAMRASPSTEGEN